MTQKMLQHINDTFGKEDITLKVLYSKRCFIFHSNSVNQKTNVPFMSLFLFCFDKHDITILEYAYVQNYNLIMI